MTCACEQPITERPIKASISRYQTMGMSTIVTMIKIELPLTAVILFPSAKPPARSEGEPGTMPMMAQPVELGFEWILLYIYICIQTTTRKINLYISPKSSLCYTVP